MPRLVLKFSIELEREFDKENYPEGPVFHRWLPDGQIDAIMLKDDPDISLKVWFERFGITAKDWDGDYIKFEYGKKDFEPTIIPKQSSLIAGPLRGRLEISVSEEQLQSLITNDKENENYIQLGKKVVRLLVLPISEFINILRINFGQYWIKELEKYDFSTNQSALYGRSLASYCNFIGLYWSVDEKDWKLFEPGKRMPGILAAVMTDNKKYLEFITKEDWKNISEIRYKEEYSVAQDMLMEFSELLDKDLLNQAIINGITSLEVAINSFMKNELKGSNAFSEVKEGSLIKKIIILGTGLHLAPTDIEGILQVYRWRNDLVHEGLTPEKALSKGKPEITTSQKKTKLELVRKMIVLLLGNKFKFPSLAYATRNTHVLSEDKWQY